MIKRKILHIRPSEKLTTRGNPDHYWVILECGHTIWEPHHPRITVWLFALEAGGKGIMTRCRDCEENKPVDVKHLSRITSWKVWKENNFDRFVLIGQGNR